MFNKLQEIITQENLDLGTQTVIFKEFKTMNETSEALNIIKIVINYSKAASANSNLSISSFIKKIYADESLRHVELVLKFNVINIVLLIIKI